MVIIITLEEFKQLLSEIPRALQAVLAGLKNVEGKAVIRSLLLTTRHKKEFVCAVVCDIIIIIVYEIGNIGMLLSNDTNYELIKL